MNDPDSFIHEVSEEIRRDRMFRLWKRYAPFVIGVVVAVVGLTALMSWLDHRRVQAARVAGGQIIEAQRPDLLPEERAGLLEDLAGTARGGPAAVAWLQAAAAHAEAGEPQAAATAFDNAAAAAAAQGEPALAALAEFRAIVLRAPFVDYRDTVAALSRLVEDGSGMQVLALEARGIAHLDAGDIEAARRDFDAVLANPEATEATLMRVREIAATLGAPGGLAG